MQKKYIQFIIGILIVQSSFSQSVPMYSQYMYNMTNINPAYAGARIAPSLTALWREQWVGLAGSPSTKTISYDFATNNNKVGLGAQVFDDKYVNNIKRTGLNLMYNIKIQVAEKGMFSAGLKFGFYNDVKNLTSFYQGAISQPNSDPAISNNLNKIVPLAGVGFFYFTDKFYVGASAPDLILFSKVANYATDKSLYQVNNIHYFLTSGYSYDLNEDVNIKPSILIKAVTGAPVEYDLNTNVWLKNIVGVGASYRLRQSVLALAEVQATPQLRVGYAYDMPFIRPNSHEFFLRYEFGRKFPKLNTYKID
jgi:type IX secretion system PorP/SprF family membrane protein